MDKNLSDILYRKEQIFDKGGNTEWLFIKEFLQWGFALVLPVLIIGVHITFKEFDNYGMRWDEFWDSATPVFIGFSWTFGKLLYNVFKHYEFRVMQHNKKIEARLDKQLEKAQIVFETSIQQFDDNHLLALHRLLNNLAPQVKNIYAIDNSDPIQWWSETMTGYLALLSNWKSMGSNRHVTRIFVFKRGQLENSLVGKLISLHSFHGMKTYVFSKDYYDKLFDYFKDNNKTVDTFKKKEVVVWDRPDDSSFSTININEHTYKKTIGYQSFWDIDWPIDERQSKPSYNNYYDLPIEREKIKTWFEFITLNGKHMDQIKVVDNHLDFINYLIENSTCCLEKKHVVPIEKDMPFGIQIKTSVCANCIKPCKKKNDDEFEFANNKAVNEILTEYVKL